MRIAAFLAVLMVASGCSPKPAAVVPPPASAAMPKPAATGIWTCGWGTNALDILTFHLQEQGGVIMGAVSFAQGAGPHRVRGILSGDRVELYYDVEHRNILEFEGADSHTNYSTHSCTFAGILSGDEIKGVSIWSAGIGRTVTNWAARRISAEPPTMPVLKEEAIVDHEFIPKNTNMVALENSWLALSNAATQVDSSRSNPVKSVRPQVRTAPSALPVSDVPTAVLQQIRDAAVTKWPNEFDMQLYEIKKQVAAWRALHGR